MGDLTAAGHEETPIWADEFESALLQINAD
jgi:hypothetical protein